MSTDLSTRGRKRAILIVFKQGETHLFAAFRLVDVLVDIGSALLVDILRDALPAPLRAILRETPGTGEGTPARQFPVGNGEVHDFADFPRLPCLRLVIGMIQRFAVNLFGAELIAG